MIRALSDADFAAATAAGVVLVLFTARWCRVCVRAVPEVAALAGTLGPRVVVMTADINAAPAAASAADVRGVPMLVLLRDGARIGDRLGHYPAPALREWIEPILLGDG